VNGKRKNKENQKTKEEEKKECSLGYIVKCKKEIASWGTLLNARNFERSH
jgi:hypothetical protein